jgi:serine/threonine protein kinase
VQSISDGTQLANIVQSNIMIDDHGVARICDFGLVRLLSNEHNGDKMTSTYTGTPRYLAYELVAAEQPIPTPASDIHALGCVGLDVRGHIVDFGGTKVTHPCLSVYFSPVATCKL